MGAHLYKNKDSTAIVIAHQKCGYSSIDYHAQQGKITHSVAMNLEMRKIMKNPNIFKMMIVRNPYARLESFYRQWIKVHPYLKDEPAMLKSAYLDLMAARISRERFINREISFEEFILGAVPVLMFMDNHLLPQTRQLEGWHCTADDFDEIIKLEDQNFDNLNSHMNIEYGRINVTDPKINKTWSNFDLKWTSRMKSLIYKAYLSDFEQLGYSKGTRI